MKYYNVIFNTETEKNVNWQFQDLNRADDFAANRSLINGLVTIELVEDGKYTVFAMYKNGVRVR